MRTASRISAVTLSALLAGSIFLAPALAGPAPFYVATAGSSTLIGGVGNDVVRAAVAHPDGGAVVAGALGEGAEGSFLSKIDASGGVTWTENLPNLHLSAIAIASGGGIVVAGRNEAADASVGMFDDKGALTWTRVLSSSASDQADGIFVDNVGRIYVAGRTEGLLNESSDPMGGALFVARLSAASGNIEWVRQRDGIDVDAGPVHMVGISTEANVVRLAYVGNGALVLHRIVFAPTSSTVHAEVRREIRAAPHSRGTPATDAVGNVYWPTSDCFDGHAPTCPGLLKLTAEGVIVWESNVPSATSGGWSNFSNAVVAADGSVYVSGWASWGFDGNQDGSNDDPLLVRYDGSGNRLWSKQYNVVGWNYAGPILILTTGSMILTSNSAVGFQGEPGRGGLDVVVTRLPTHSPIGPVVPPAGGRYVALGDSFASGEGAAEGTFLPGTSAPDPNLNGKATTGCHRSTTSWAYSVKGAVEDTAAPLDQFRFVACSGAETKDLYGRNEIYETRTGAVEAPQISHVTEDTRLVTLSMGGNDVGFSTIIKNCVGYLNSPGGYGCSAPGEVSYKTAQDGLTKLREGLETPEATRMRTPLPAVYVDIARIMDQGVIAVTGYPRLFDERRKKYPPVRASGANSSRFCKLGTVRGALPISVQYDDALWMNSVARQANTTIEASVRNANDYLTAVDSKVRVVFVDVDQAFTYHRLCSGDRWFNGVELAYPVADPRKATQKQTSVHPNLEGQRAYAAAVLEKLKAESVIP